MSDDGDRCVQTKHTLLPATVQPRLQVVAFRDTLRILVATDNHLVSDLIANLACGRTVDQPTVQHMLAGSLGEG